MHMYYEVLTSIVRELAVTAGALTNPFTLIFDESVMGRFFLTAWLK